MTENPVFKVHATELEIFEKLVKDENDIVGMIAFALYKKSEFRYIVKYSTEKGEYPSVEMLCQHRSELMPNLNMYYHRHAEHMAQGILQTEKLLEIAKILNEEQVKSMAILTRLDAQLDAVHKKVLEQKKGFLKFGR